MNIVIFTLRASVRSVRGMLIDTALNLSRLFQRAK